MSNIDKVIEVLNGQGACCGDCLREPGDPLSYCGDCARCLSRYAQALAEAGLIAPDLPEPINQEGSPTWIKHPYGVSVEKHPCGNGYVISTPYAEWENPGGARKVALALLAAANAIEGELDG